MTRALSWLAVTLVLASAVACASDDHSDDALPQTGAGAGGANGGGTSGTAGTGGHGGTGAGGAGGTSANAGSSGAAAAGGSHDDAGVLDSGQPIDADAGSDGAIEEPPNEACLAGIADYKAAGPFEYEAATWPTGTGTGGVKAWIPEVPEGCRVPIVHFTNGTGAACMNYQSTLEHLASHGFLAICFETAQADAGTRCIEAAELAFENVPALVSKKLGFAGHESGGVGAFYCVYRAEEAWGASHSIAGYANAPSHGIISPDDMPSWHDAYAAIDSPMFMFNTEGGLVSEGWVGQAMDYIPETTELYWYKAVGATDIPVANDWMEESTVAWFRWKLLGDRAACEYFKAMPDGDDWDFKGSSSPRDCK